MTILVEIYDFIGNNAYFFEGQGLYFVSRETLDHVMLGFFLTFLCFLGNEIYDGPIVDLKMLDYGEALT